MNFELPEELRILRDTMNDFVDRELIPIELDCVEGPGLKPEYRQQLEAKTKAMGLWLLDAPAEYGGHEIRMPAQVVIWEAMARSIAVPARDYGIFGPEVKQIMYRLNAEQKERYMLPLLRGEKKTAFAQTEPDAGSDPSSMRTTAVRQGDHYVINGYKRFITNASGADFFQLVAATDRSKGSRGGLSMFLVDRDTPGLSLVRKTETMMSAVTWELAFDNMKVPVANLIGQEGEGMGRAQEFLVGNRLRQACNGLGAAQRCIELMTRYAKQRVTFGQPLAERQAVQFMIADSVMEHHAVQLLIHQTAAKLDAGKAVRHEGYIAKMCGTELGHRVANRCMQIHGGMGLTKELPIEKMWRSTRANIITEGPAEVMRMVLARSILKNY